MIVYVINGRPRSGKDSFVKCCQELVGDRCLNLSTVDKVKEIARQCGWDGSKTLKNREFLSDLKDLLTKWADIPYKDVINRIAVFRAELNDWLLMDDSIVFVHVREPVEIQKFVDRIGAKTLLIRRPLVENETTSNHADQEVFNFNYDETIWNDKGLDELKEKARAFLKKNDISINEQEILHFL